MKRASELVDQVFGSLRIEDEADAVSLFQQWEQIAGSDIASHSHILELEGRTLVVSVDHPGWVQMLQMKKRTILKTIERSYPELHVDRIRIVLG